MWAWPWLQSRSLCGEKYHEEDWMSTSMEKGQHWWAAHLWQFHNVKQLWLFLLVGSGLGNWQPDKINKMSDALLFYGVYGSVFLYYFWHVNMLKFCRSKKTLEYTSHMMELQDLSCGQYFQWKKFLLEERWRLFPLTLLWQIVGAFSGCS